MPEVLPNAIERAVFSCRILRMFAEYPNSEYVRIAVIHRDNPALRTGAGVWKSSFKNRNAMHFGPSPKIETNPRARMRYPGCPDASGRSSIQSPVFARFPYGNVRSERPAWIRTHSAPED